MGKASLRPEAKKHEIDNQRADKMMRETMRGEVVKTDR